MRPRDRDSHRPFSRSLFSKLPIKPLQGCTEAGCKLYSDCPIQDLNIKKIDTQSELTDKVKQLASSQDLLKTRVNRISQRLSYLEQQMGVSSDNEAGEMDTPLP